MILKVSNVLTVAIIDKKRNGNSEETITLHLALVSLIIKGKITWSNARTASNLLE